MGTILSNNQTQKMKRDKNCQITSDFCMYMTMGGVRRRVNNNNDKMTQYDDASLTDPNLDYLLNLAEMNLIQPEDLDEIGKSSQSVSKKIMKKKESKGEKKADPEEETINAIFNAEVVYSDS
ncbi:hypothetical protein C1645_732107 [Glomus cerebriforme]|uniref:Uncharacterized protein n=1 Tax=Glomus cerebriforme TaxID=658196 RepID=A0A397TRY9_9GLOM|nr:hypothetical protein C1645_732107 [Glomus cerebriforme]